jgi:hypothetical protein
VPHDDNPTFAQVKRPLLGRYSGRVRALVPILLLALVMAAGCGSKSPKQQFVAKLNSMCEDFAAREQQIGEPTSPDDLAARGNRIVEAYDEAILLPLLAEEAPAEIEPQVEQLRVVARQQLKVLRGLAEAGRVGDVTKVRQLVARNTTLNGQAGRIAGDLEADSCAS